MHSGKHRQACSFYESIYQAQLEQHQAAFRSRLVMDSKLAALAGLPLATRCLHPTHRGISVFTSVNMQGLIVGNHAPLIHAALIVITATGLMGLCRIAIALSSSSDVLLTLVTSHLHTMAALAP